MTEAQRAKATKKVNSYIERMKALGCCEQCQHPWHDGLCPKDGNCAPPMIETEEIVELALELLEEGISL